MVRQDLVSIQISKENIAIKEGKPPSSGADCVCENLRRDAEKNSTRGYTPAPPEFMSGTIKTNKIPYY